MKYDINIQRLKALVEKEFAQFFYIAKGKVFQEKEVVDYKGSTWRLDRLIIDENEAWVIDYKSGVEATLDYQAQVKNYITIVQSLYPNLKVRGFLLYLDELKVEEVYG